MYLDYSKIEFDSSGLPEVPELVLKTLGGKTTGVIPGVFNLKFNIKFSEPSEISFDIPSEIDGVKNPFYDLVTGHRQIYTKNYGIYEIMNPKSEEDGISDIKHIQGYSYEKTLESKKFFIEEGTFNFWNPASPADTVIGRILEIASGWSAGYIAPTLIGRYRTFDKYDDYLLSFVYNKAPKKFRCVFVFDTYKKTINAYDADAELPNLPIYLDFDNLLESLEIEEMDGELVTAIRPYGADGLDIRDVNPIGTNWIYDISYFIANGDIEDPLASKWTAWQRSILNNQLYYKGLTAMRASANAKLLSEKAALAELKGELENLTAQQSVAIQAIALETTSAGKAGQQAVLNNINEKISSKKSEISRQESSIDSISRQLDADNPSSYTAQIQAVTKKLAVTNYFTSAEYAELSNYFIEQDITEDTFVATSVDESISGESYSIQSGSVSVTGSAVSEVDLTADFGKKMYVMAGGAFALSGGKEISGGIIRGTLEVTGSSYVLSFYAGEIQTAGKTAADGMITLSGTLSGLKSNISAVTADGITTREGSELSFSSRSGSLFLTANVSDYQKYSVQMELFEYAANTLNELAVPTYEFSVDSGNFLFAKEFAPFRNKLELGKGVYLNIGDNKAITPYIIEFELNFEERSQFSIVFSNRFKRHDYVNTLKDMLESSYSSGRNFDAGKYIYNQTAGQMSTVSKFMSDSLDAAKNTILAAANQSVVIDGAGIHVGGESKYEIRVVDRMIAMTDDNWQTAKMAMGLFASPEIGEYWGVNAEVIGGKLIIGNNLIIENTNDRGVMQFRVDAAGAWLYNASFVLQSGGKSRAGSGGLMILDPDYGIVAGTSLLFDTNGTAVTPEFLDKNGTVTYDSDGMPENANFFLDIRDGSAYFRGHLNATSGTIGGWTLEDQYLRGGSGSSFVALNGSSSNSQSLYAVWAGAANPGSAPFWVKKDGSIYAKNGTFSGTLSAARISGTLTGESDAWLEGCGIRAGKNSRAAKGYNFYVDSSGNVWMQGDLKLSNGVITWDNLHSGVGGEIDSRISAGITSSENKLTLFVQDTKNDIEKQISKIEISTGEISLSVQNVKSSLEKEIAEINVRSDQISLSVQDVKSSLEKEIAEINVRSDQISLSVQDVKSSLEKEIAEINVRSDQISLSVQNVKSSLEKEIAEIETAANQISLSVQSVKKDLEAEIAKIELYSNGIKLSVTNGSTSSCIELKSGNTVISSADITMNGLVTFKGLSEGTTTINGSCIKTGTIDAKYLNLSGAITFNDFSNSAQSKINGISDAAGEAYDYADDAYSRADKAYKRADKAYDLADEACELAAGAQDTVTGWCYEGTTYIDGASIMTGTVMASKLIGGEIELLDSREEECGSIIVSSTKRGYGIELKSSSGGIRINPRDDFWVDADYGSFGITESGVVCGADCVPQRGGRYSLGGSSWHWNDVYADNGEIITSDLRVKNNVEYGLEKYSNFFDRLQPISYLLDNGVSGRRHIGLGAQDVEKAMSECGLSGTDFAGLIKSPRTDENNQVIDGEFNYALRYTEFVSMLIFETQRLKTEVKKLKEQIAEFYAR